MGRGYDKVKIVRLAECDIFLYNRRIHTKLDSKQDFDPVTIFFTFCQKFVQIRIHI